MPNLPTQPLTFSTPYVLPTGGTTWHVHAGDNLQTTLDAAHLGDVIVLDAGATFTGNFKLPIKTGTGWLYIISSQLSSLPEGYRVNPTSVSHMPTLLSPSGSNLPILSTYRSANHYRFVGIEIKVSTTISSVNTILTGYGSANYTDPISSWVVAGATTDANLPHHITFDRCYIHSTNVYPIACRCGWLMNGHYMAAVDNYFKNFADGSDAQAINIFMGTGPYKIVNNYLEATGENFMIGGSDPSVPNANAEDVEFRGNYLYKDQAAWGTHWTIKNLCELKNGRRVLITGNVMENCYSDQQGQQATGITLTVRDQGNNNQQAQLQDITVTNNIIHSVGKAWRVTGFDSPNISLQTQRVLIENNSADDVNYNYSIGAGFTSISSTNQGPILDLTIRHNLEVGWSGFLQNMSTISAPTNFYALKNYIDENNIYTHGRYGLFGNVVGSGTVALTRYVDPAGTLSWTKNVLIMRAVDPDFSIWTQTYFNSHYPTGNGRAVENAGVGFTDAANADYRLTSSSPYHNWASDGTDPGPNWTALNLATAHSKDGQAGTITLVAPQNFTVI